MKLRASIIPLCECGDHMSQQSWHDKGDGVVWHCPRCWRRYFVRWTYIDAMVLPELRKEVIERKPE